jgi:hypothetical protein
MDLLLAQASWLLGELPDAQLPEEVGVRALEDGMDTPTLRVLASLTSEERSDARQRFDAVLNEFNIPRLDLAEAARLFATSVCRKIVNEGIDPIDAANLLWDVSLRVRDPLFHDLDPFIYAASEAKSRPSDVPFFRDAIVSEARDRISAATTQT